MQNNPYDINKIFSDMEQKLMASYNRNMSKHTSDELKEGFKWEMWQANKLRDMKAYTAENRYIVDTATKKARDAATGIVKDSFGAGKDAADALLHTLGTSVSGAESFGRMNRRKVDALVQAASNDLNKVRAATLRMTDDAYRQIIYKSQLMHAAGGTTLRQSVDMAAKDFLANGINAIVYKNGARVNIASYAEMAIRNSSKKAYLVGEGARQAEWGVDLVQVTSYGACSDLCIPWQGKIYLDNVYAGGRRTPENAQYPLLSSAMANGLYHPNCRHTQGAYFEGISEPIDKPNNDKIRENYKAEQRQRQIERNIRKYKRVSEGSLDPLNQKKAQAKTRAWQGEMRQHLKNNPELSRKYGNEKTYGIPVDATKIAGYVPPIKFLPTVPEFIPPAVPNTPSTGKALYKQKLAEYYEVFLEENISKYQGQMSMADIRSVSKSDAKNQLRKEGILNSDKVVAKKAAVVNKPDIYKMTPNEIKDHVQKKYEQQLIDLFHERSAVPKHRPETWDALNALTDKEDRIRKQIRREIPQTQDHVIAKNYLDKRKSWGTDSEIYEAMDKAVTIEEIQAVGLKYLDVAHIDYTDFHPDIAKQINKQVFHLRGKFPEINATQWLDSCERTYMQGLGKAYDPASRAMAFSTNSGWGKLEGVSFRESYIGDKMKFNQAMRSSQNSKWLSPSGDGVTAIYSHEYGHQIDNYLNKGNSGMYDNVKVKIQNYMKNDASWIKQNLSEYGSTEECEFFAEAMAEYIGNPFPRAVAKDIGDTVMMNLKYWREVDL